MILDDLTEVESPPPSDTPAKAFPKVAYVADALARLGPVLARLEPATIKLPLFQRKPPFAGPSCSPTRVDPSAELINISDDEEWIDWNLLEKEIDEEEERSSGHVMVSH